MKKILVFSILFLVSFSLYAAEVEHIDNETLKELGEQGVAIIDVRATSEWKDTGIIEGSHLMMFYDEQGKYNLDEWLNKLLTAAEKNEPVILICRTGSRSRQLAKYLTKVVGYEEVYNVKKGIVHWIKQNNPIVEP